VPTKMHVDEVSTDVDRLYRSLLAAKGIRREP
jgi:hypothetical protein